jgi:deoxyribodipyrimidine photo-lyase
MTQQERSQQTGRMGLVWYRTGLRLEDNTALFAALQENESVVCLYVLDDNYMRGADIGAARAAFLLDSLAELGREIAAHGGQLILRRTREVPSEVVRTAQEVGAGRIYVHDDYLPYPKKRDATVREMAAAEGIGFQSYRDLLLVDPARVLSEEGAPYTVFTPFKRRWEGLLNTPPRYEMAPLLPRLRQSKRFSSAPLPTLADYGLSLTQRIEPGGAGRAQDRLAEFVRAGLPLYHQNRDICADPNSTSRLSMHLKWGTLSVRDCYRAARAQEGPGADKWIDELAWREFFHAVIFHFPHALTGPMLPEYGDFPWSDDQDHFEAWKAGQTGYPFVDAGMRQMNATGWMHNRLRQVVASYLCKDLGFNWQEGERYFMQQLVDGDWPSNNGGWQWVAGTGTDPRRATRIFNPVLQQERYDPEFSYIRQWVPEYGTTRYPAPIVRHEEGREAFLERFRSTAPARQAAREARKEEKRRRRRERKGGAAKTVPTEMGEGS